MKWYPLCLKLNPPRRFSMKSSSSLYQIPAYIPGITRLEDSEKWQNWLWTQWESFLAMNRITVILLVRKKKKAHSINSIYFTTVHSYPRVHDCASGLQSGSCCCPRWISSIYSSIVSYYSCCRSSSLCGCAAFFGCRYTLGNAGSLFRVDWSRSTVERSTTPLEPDCDRPTQEDSTESQ